MVWNAMLQLDLFVPRLFHSIVSTYDDTCRTVFIVRLFLVSINNNKPVRDGVSSRSRGSTKRAHWRVNGETKHSSVRLANKLARRLAYMLVLHEKKKQFYIIENPLSSLLWRFNSLRRVLRRHKARMVTVMLGAYGAPTAKPVP